jgi:hypothetical protein
MDYEQIRSIDVLTGQINALPNYTDPGDKALDVRFLMHSHLDDLKTREQGRPVFEMREYIKITIPGDTSNVFRPIRETDKERFPEQWMRFKAGQEQVQGTPLTEWSQITKAQVDELAYFRISTIEQLALVSDANCQKYMGLSDMRSRAQRYLEQRKEEAPMLKMEAELHTRDEQISAMQAQIVQLKELVDSVSGKKTPPVELVASVDDELFEK